MTNIFAAYCTSRCNKTVGLVIQPEPLSFSAKPSPLHTRSVAPLVNRVLHKFDTVRARHDFVTLQLFRSIPFSEQFRANSRRVTRKLVGPRTTFISHLNGETIEISTVSLATADRVRQPWIGERGTIHRFDCYASSLSRSRARDPADPQPEDFPIESTERGKPVPLDGRKISNRSSGYAG